MRRAGPRDMFHISPAFSLSVNRAHFCEESTAPGTAAPHTRHDTGRGRRTAGSLKVSTLIWHARLRTGMIFLQGEPTRRTTLHTAVGPLPRRPSAYFVGLYTRAHLTLGLPIAIRNRGVGRADDAVWLGLVLRPKCVGQLGRVLLVQLLGRPRLKGRQRHALGLRRTVGPSSRLGEVPEAAGRNGKEHSALARLRRAGSTRGGGSACASASERVARSLLMVVLAVVKDAAVLVIV